MKTATIIIVMVLFINEGFAQSNNSRCCRNPYEKAAYNTFQEFRTDTLLSFNDGENVYASYMVHKYRSDTTVSVNDSIIELIADTIHENDLTEYGLFTVPVTPPIVDTIRDPDDPYIILAIDTMKEESWDYAKIHNLDSSSFFDEIDQVIGNIKSQGLGIQNIEILIFNSKNRNPDFESLRPRDLRGVNYARANFILEKGQHSLEYPIIFERKKYGG